MDPSSPRLFLIGISHHTAPLEIREKLALGPEDLQILHARVKEVEGIRETLVLSTCNRVEVYAVGLDGAAERLAESVCAAQSLDRDLFRRIAFERQDSAAVQHLLEVAVGLDSQMVGEAEILGQVKDSYTAAQESGSLGPVLHRVLQKAFQAAKWVRSNTAIGSGNVSVANVAVDLAQKIFGDLKKARVLVLGAGEIGEKTARAFHSRGAGRITVANRTLERAVELAHSLYGEAIPFESAPAALFTADVVVASTSAPQAVVREAMVAAALKQRPSRPLLLVDLALPRDIESSAANHSNVYLYNLDDLAEIAEANRQLRLSEMERCRTLTSHKAQAIWQHIASRFGSRS